MRDDGTKLILKRPKLQSRRSSCRGVLKTWQQDARVRNNRSVIFALLGPFAKSIQLKDHSYRSALKSREPIHGLIYFASYAQDSGQ